MIKNLLLSFLCLIVFSISSQAQECMGMTLKAGSGFDMDSFDGKGKPSGKMTYKIVSVTKEGSNSIITIDFESFNTKGKSELKNNYKMRCDGNALTLDASSLISQEQLKSFENFQMKFTSEDIVYPVKYTVGEKLKDASLKGEGASGPLKITFNMLISNRKIESQDKLTIPAGSFDAYKITSDMLMQTKMGLGAKIDMHTVSYRAPGVLWDLKTETYRKGKLIATTELTKIY